MPKLSPLAERLSQVKQRIAAAAEKAGRTQRNHAHRRHQGGGAEQVREILQLGVGDLGENRVQVLTQRVSQFNEFYQRRKKSGDDAMAPRRALASDRAFAAKQGQRRFAAGRLDSARGQPASGRRNGHASRQTGQTHPRADAGQCLGRVDQERRGGRARRSIWPSRSTP